MPMPMTGSWAATRGRWRCPSPISPDSRSTAGSSTSDAAPALGFAADAVVVSVEMVRVGIGDVP